jgi:hypothetical protein
MAEQGLLLERATFEFSQDSNCVSEKEYEFLTVEVESSLGIDRDEGEQYFYVLKTEGWSIDSEEDLKKIFDRISKAIKK